MHQLLILIPLSVDMELFDAGWPDFLQEAEQMPGLVQESVYQIDRAIFGQNFLRRIYRFTFPDKETLDQALLSPPGEKAGEILHNITRSNLILLSGEVKGDSLDHIQSLSSS